MIEHIIFLRNPTRVDDAANRHAVLFHVLQNDTRVKRGALDRGEQFILRRVSQIPTERDPAEFGIHQNGAVPIVPGQPEQTGLASAKDSRPSENAATVVLARCAIASKISPVAESPASTPAILGSTEPGTTPQTPGISERCRDRDNTGRRADHVHHIADAYARTNRVPMRVKSAYRNGNSRAQSELGGPDRRKHASQNVAGRISSVQVCPDALKQRIHGSQKLFGWQATERGIPHPLMAHRANSNEAPSPESGSPIEPPQPCRNVPRPRPTGRASRNCGAASGTVSKSPIRTNRYRRTNR